MPHYVAVSKFENFQKTKGMANHTLHRIFTVRPRVVGISLTDLVYCYDPALTRQPVKIQVQVRSTIGTVR